MSAVHLWPRRRHTAAGFPWGTMLVFAAYSLVGTHILSLALSALGIPDYENCNPFTWLNTSIAYVFGPAVENALMVGIFEALHRLTGRKNLSSIAASLVLAATHSLLLLYWGLFVIWPWFVFGQSYLCVRGASRRQAFLVSVGVHSLHNVGVTAIASLLIC